MKDSDIISQAIVGNKGAYRELLRKYANLTLAVAYARAGNVDTARLAAADAFITASRELAGLPETAPISPWLANITRTATANRMSGVRRISYTEEAAKEKIRGMVEEAGGPGKTKAEAKNELAFIAFSSLTDEEREVLCLLHLYSKSYADIGSAMAREAGEADELLAKARDRLATALEPLHGQPV